MDERGEKMQDGIKDLIYQPRFAPTVTSDLSEE